MSCGQDVVAQPLVAGAEQVLKLGLYQLILSMLKCQVESLIFMFVAVMSMPLTSCRIGDVGVIDPPNFSLDRGAGTFEFSTPTGAQSESVTLHYCIPLTGDIDEMPVLFVFHGAERNAASYANDWRELADAHDVMVFVPEFTENDYPTSIGYQQGNVIAGSQIRPQEEWLFSLIEPMFDEIQARLGVSKVSYDAWGHSAGAQFLHRFVLMGGDVRMDRGIAANAGWYTVPEEASSFPYGLAGSPISESDLMVPFGLDLIIHLGTLDTIFMETGWTGAYAQGDNRYDRGHYFYEQAVQIASANNLVLNWELQEVPGVGHEQVAMASAGAQILYP